MEGDGRCDASWRCVDTKDGAAARWTSLWSGKAKIPMETSGKNPGSVSHISRRIYVTKRGSSRASFSGHAARKRLVDGPPSEPRRDRDRRERERPCSGARVYEIGREGRLRNPAALEPQPRVD
jgi:hypothetical protein